MSTKPKNCMEMTPEEYRRALADILRNPPGMSAAERADLAERRGQKPTPPKSAMDMTPEEFAVAVQKAIRGEYP